MAHRGVVRRDNVLFNAAVFVLGEPGAGGIVPSHGFLDRLGQQVKVHVQLNQQTDADVQHLFVLGPL